MATTASKETGFGPGGNISGDDAIAFAERLPAFKNWKAKLTEQFGQGFKGIKVMDVYPFGPVTTAVRGFVMGEANVTRGNTKPAGFAFIRGGAVAVLPILIDENNKKYVLTTIQARVPGGEAFYEEIPAGMLDNSSNFAGVAAKEMKEETTLTVNASDLIPLSMMYPSIGGCDENIKIYLYQVKLGSDEIKLLEGVATGNPDENEAITLKIRPYEEFKEECLRSKGGEVDKPVGISDAKAQIALGMYELMLQAGTIPDAEDKTGTVKEGLTPLANVGNVFNAQTEGGRKRTRKHKHKSRKGKSRRHRK
jgi:ADP-sugar diphosphatase